MIELYLFFTDRRFEVCRCFTAAELATTAKIHLGADPARITVRKSLMGVYATNHDTARSLRAIGCSEQDLIKGLR